MTAQLHGREEDTADSSKKVYQKPSLTARGNILTLTQGGFSSGSDVPMTGFIGGGSDG